MHDYGDASSISSAQHAHNKQPLSMALCNSQPQNLLWGCPALFYSVLLCVLLDFIIRRLWAMGTPDYK